MEKHIEGTKYGDSYIWLIVWRLIFRVQYMETHIGGTMYGVSYLGENVWRHI